MKIVISDDINMIIFLNNEYLKNKNFENEDEFENYFKDLFINLKENYNIKINGYYNICVYIDKAYGVVLELEKEDLDYIDYYDNQVDMRIVVHYNHFIYCIDEEISIDDLSDKLTLFFYQDKIYVDINSTLDAIQMGRLIEHSEIIYKDYDKIVKYGKRLEVV